MPLVALLLLSAQVARTPTPVAAPLTRGYPVCAGVRVLAPNLATQPRDLIFSSRQVLDLQFQARVRRDLQGDHLMQFKVFTPGGFLYQVITVPFVGTAPAPERAAAARARSGAATRAPGAASAPATSRATRGRCPCRGWCPSSATPRTRVRSYARERRPARGRDVDHPELAVRALDGAVVPRRPAGPRAGRPPGSRSAN